MLDNYEHYITRNIRAFYKRRLLVPILYLLLLFFLWIAFPLSDMLLPKEFASLGSMEYAHKTGKDYVSVTFSDLQFTGYTSTRFGQTNGYFYYGQDDNGLYIVLLAPTTCEEGLPTIESLTTTCRIVYGKESYEKLLEHLAVDLEWSKDGISSQLSTFYFSEPDYNPLTTRLLFFTYFSCLAFTVISLLSYITFIYHPVLAPACQNLIIYGNPREMLEEAEEELATLPQLATEDMFITEHYFIMTSAYGNAIVPIKEILWIYKYSTLHKVLWYHFSISYTLHIFADKHLFIQCPKNIKSDIDGIIDYLAEANHDIVVGFNEKNRLKVLEKLRKPFQLEKWTAIFEKKKK